MPKGISPAWVCYMRSIYQTSPLLRSQLSQNRDCTHVELLDLLGIARRESDGA